MRYALLFLILLIPCVGFLSYFISSYCRPHIEGSLEKSATEVLKKAGLQNVGVSFDRLDATLTGSVNSVAERKKAASIIAALDGARLLPANNRLLDPSVSSPMPTPDPVVELAEEVPLDPSAAPDMVAPQAALSLNYNDTAVTIRGRVPSEAFREKVLSTIKAAKPDHVIDDNHLVVDSEVEVPIWGEGMGNMLESFLPSVGQGELQVDEYSLVLAGTVPDEETRVRFLTEAAEWMGSADPVNSNLAVAVPEPPVVDQEALVSVFKKNAIYFASGSQELNAEDVLKLGEIAESLKGSPGLRLFVGGYADKSGNPEANRRLSLARALRVKNELVELGLPEEALVVESFGAEELSADEAWKSRRVELSIQE